MRVILKMSAAAAVAYKGRGIVNNLAPVPEL